jgi:hypothetical protein
MTRDRPASWRFPKPKEIERIERMARMQRPAPAPELAHGPADPPSEAWWQSVLNDPAADRQGWIGIHQRRLSEIPRHVLRVECRRCLRTVEIQKLDAIRMYGEHATWKEVGQRLLDSTCQNRTGRHEEDGCWPKF